MLSWQVGRVKITSVEEMQLPIPAGAEMFMPQATAAELRKSAWLYPHFVRAEDGALKVSIHALLVETPGMRLVVDTCVGNDRPRGLVGNRPLSTPFLEHLKEAGWAREGVDVVICTHLHVDHVGWNTMLQAGKWVPTFPNARYLIGRREFEHWSAEGEGERAMITGDIMHHPVQIAHPEWAPGFDSDREAAIVTRHRVLDEVADAPILVIGTHFAAPTAGRIRRDGGAYRMEC